MFLKFQKSQPQYSFKAYSYLKKKNHNDNNKKKIRVYKNNSKTVKQYNAVIAGWAR